MKVIMIVLLFMLSILISGCSRQIESDELQIDLVDDPPIPITLSITHLADGIRLTWQVADTLSGMSFNVYYSETLDEGYILWEKTGNFNSSITSLKLDQLYFFKVSSVLSDGLEGKMSVAAETQPGVISITINGGEDYTNSRNVSLGFVVPQTASLIKLSENPDFAGSVWKNFASTMGFEVSNGDGTKHVYAHLRFSDGSDSDTINAISDSIILDTEARIDSVYFTPAGILFTANSSVTFYLATSESTGEAGISFPGLNGLKLTYDESASNPAGSEYIFSRAYLIPHNLEVIDAPVAGHYTDEAGNRAQDLNAEALLNIANPPVAVTLSAVAESSSSIRLSWSKNIDNDFAAYQLYRGLDNSVSNASEPVVIVDNSSNLSYTDTGLDENTRYFYRIYVYDNTGLFAPSIDADALTLANQAPDPVTLAARVEIIDSDTTVALSWTVNNDDDFDSYRVYRTDDTTQAMDSWSLLNIINSQSVTTFTDIFPPAGNVFYRIMVFDIQDKYSSSNWASK